ncbi:UDP-glucuronosyltransferase 2B20 [Drosophila subobscura]|uniref:UDP-glucuronosyltransferase 2B20 n=1 Tax=Drosophila subobscura TaxID=7241 RepID=UPI00155AFBBD|nr:UDP-glucuronosyltransferase 2B20 [Drosophila subobscura]XP_034669971.1 UDP-glucuronosyltransferase 2B20 [Drosophila subobscura]
MSGNRNTLLGCSLGGLLLALLALHSLPQSSEGSNILGVFTSHSPSHFIVHMSIMKSLAEKGHNVTVVSSVPPKVTHKSIKHIVIPLSDEDEKTIHGGMVDMVKQKPSIWTTMKSVLSSLSLLINTQVDTLEDKRFTDLYNNKDNKFDVLFVGFFFNTYQVGLGAKFNCPLIISWMAPPLSMVNELIGNPELSSVPQMQISVAAGKPMNFQQRVANFFSTAGFGVLGKILDFRYKGFYKRLWGDDKNMPSLETAMKNVSLVFCNSHGISEGPVRPNVPAVIEIGGIQVKSKPDPLPEDIKEFMDNAKNGAILFSLGSNLKGEYFQPEVVSTIYKTLSSLKQHVIWKWEDPKNTPGKSANILYKKWLPQDDILAHPKLKLFITHAGKGGMAEAQYHGVPMLALPVFADQPGNADKIVENGYGLRLELTSLDVKEFKEAINDIVNNPKYAQKVKTFSKLYRDRPQTPQESVVYWTEYVIRHHGAPHMQSPLVHMGIIASKNLDIYALVALALYLIFLINKVVWKFLWRKCTGKSKKAPQNKKVKKQ